MIAVAFRYVSLGSVAVAAAFSPAGVGAPRIRGFAQLIFIALVSALVIWRHRQKYRPSCCRNGIEDRSKIGNRIREIRSKPTMSRIAVIGAGAWGTALAIASGRKGTHQIRLWANEPEVLESIAKSRIERALSARIHPSGIDCSHQRFECCARRAPRSSSA